MNSAQRVEAAFRGEEPDKLPVHHLGFSSGVASALLGREAHVGGGIQMWREATALWEGEEAHREFLERTFCDAIDLALLTHQDILRVGYWRYNVKPTRRIDEYTFSYEYGPEEQWKVLQYNPTTEDSTTPGYTTSALTFAALERHVREQERAVADYRPAEEDFALEIRAQRLMGSERPVRVSAVLIAIPLVPIWLEATALRPDLVERYLDVQAERAKRNVEFLAPYGFRLFFGGGDLGSNAGTMYSPRVFREIMLPRIMRISTACHAAGGYHLFNSDGNTWPVADDLFGGSGVDGYYEIDRRAGMGLLRLRQRFPDLTLIGNISSHSVHRASVEEVVAETLACIDEAKRAKKAIVGVSNYFVHDSPVENVQAVIETIEQHR